MENDKLKRYLDDCKVRWTMGLTYMADDRLKNQYKTAEAHLNIILNEIKHFLDTETKPN